MNGIASPKAVYIFIISSPKVVDVYRLNFVETLIIYFISMHTYIQGISRIRNLRTFTLYKHELDI